MLVNIKKSKRILCLLVIFFIAAAGVLYLNTDIQSKFAYDRHHTFYNLQFFKKQYVVEVSGINMIAGKILLSGDALKISSFVLNKSNYILCSNDSVIRLYSLEGRFVSEYKLEDKKIISLCTGDLNSDGTDETLMVTGKDKNGFGDEILILSYKNGFAQLYKKSMEDLKPWKIQFCDVDGDKKSDISIGVYKTTPFHPVMSKRPFIYNWDSGFISPKWLGSRLSQPFDDYVFCDVDRDGMDEIAAIESTKDNKKVISMYKWKGFGVELMASGDKYSDIKGISVSDSNLEKNVNVKVKEKNVWVIEKVLYNNGRIILK